MLITAGREHRLPESKEQVKMRLVEHRLLKVRLRESRLPPRCRLGSGRSRRARIKRVIGITELPLYYYYY